MDLYSCVSFFGIISRCLKAPCSSVQTKACWVKTLGRHRAIIELQRETVSLSQFWTSFGVKRAKWPHNIEFVENFIIKITAFFKFPSYCCKHLLLKVCEIFHLINVGAWFEFRMFPCLKAALTQGRIHCNRQLDSQELN